MKRLNSILISFALIMMAAVPCCAISEWFEAQKEAGNLGFIIGSVVIFIAIIRAIIRSKK